MKINIQTFVDSFNWFILKIKFIENLIESNFNKSQNNYINSKHKPTIYKFFQYLILGTLFILPFIKTFFVNAYYGHDIILHVRRIYVLEEAIKQGILFPRWISEAVYGYGSPIYNFIWGVPYYFGALLHLMGVSYHDVFKILIYIPALISGFGMYCWLRQKKFSAFIASVSSIIYIWTPYRLLDSLVRGAIGEISFFAFLPLVFLFLDKANINKSLIFGSICLFLLIYSHHGLALFGLIIIFLYIAVNYFINHNLPLLKRQFALIILALFLSTFYLLPGLVYSLLLPNKFFSITELGFPPLMSLIRSKWEGGSVFNGERLIMSYQIGLMHLLIIALSHLLLFFNIFFKKKIKEIAQFILFIGIFWLAIFLMNPISRWFWVNIPLIINIQFPYRLLFLPMFVTPVLTAIFLKNLKPFLSFVAGTMFVFGVLIANRNHLWIENKNDDFFTYWDLDTLDVKGETLPSYVDALWLRTNQKTQSKLEEFSIIKGEGKIIYQNRADYASKAKIILDTAGDIYIKRTYFPGWKIKINGQKINNFQKNNGIILSLESGNYLIDLKFEENLLMKLSNSISILTAFSIIIYSGFIFKNTKNEK